jgi:CRISPR-associated protein Csy2
MKDILLIPNIKIHNANALSSPYTIGFPAMTAWLGFMHALERKLQNSDFSDVKFTGLIVSCLNINLHTYKGKGDYVHSIIATSNPLDKTEKRPSFIEEARCDIEVSIAIECKIGIIDYDEFTNFIDNLLPLMKIASGDILSFKNSKHLEVANNEPRSLTKYLMPGFCLVSRQDLITQAMQDGQDAIDALLDYLKTTREIEINDNKKTIKNKTYNKEQGWLVPIAIGYQGISDLKIIKNQRDATTLHKFAESILTLGEFKMPHHFDNIDEMIWHYKRDEDNDLYLCQNNFLTTTQESKL